MRLVTAILPCAFLGGGAVARGEQREAQITFPEGELAAHGWIMADGRQLVQRQARRDLAIYDKALSIARIKEHYARRKP